MEYIKFLVHPEEDVMEEAGQTELAVANQQLIWPV
jgi:hypothetical protein